MDFFRRGILDRLPATVLHPIIDCWYDDDGRGVLVMRDLGEAMLNWMSVVSREQARTMFRAIADLHASFAGSAPEGLTPLGSVVGIFEPRRIRPYAGEVGERVLALAQDPAPLVAACLALPTALLHRDLATVNMALEPGRAGCLTLIDWGLAAEGPAELDIGRLLVGCAHVFGATLDDLVALQREAAGPAYHDPALRLGLLAGLIWLGWNKALDIVEHPDPAVRERERVGAAVVAASGRAGLRDRHHLRGTTRWM